MIVIAFSTSGLSPAIRSGYRNVSAVRTIAYASVCGSTGGATGRRVSALARRAHEDLRARATVGKLVLDPRS